MVANKLAAFGMGFVVAMHGVLLAAAIPHPTWSAVQGIGLAGALMAMAGLWLFERRVGLALLAGGLGLEAVSRAIALAGPGAGVVLPSVLLLGFALATISGALWAAKPAAKPDARASGVRFGLALVGLGTFATMIDAISGRPLAAILALAIGAIGWAFVAPNVEALPEHAAWRPRAKKPKAKRADAAQQDGGAESAS